jgi:hypothetical protein
MKFAVQLLYTNKRFFKKAAHEYSSEFFTGSIEFLPEVQRLLG